MEGLNFTDVGDVLLVVKVAGGNPSQSAWQCLHDALLKRADTCRGLLVVADGEPPSTGGRALMKDAFTRAPKLRIAFLTANPVVRMVINSIVRWTLGDRVAHVPNVAAALQHLGASVGLEASILEEVRKLRQVGMREAA